AGGIYLDYFINLQFQQQHIAVTPPYMNPTTCLLIVVGAMLVGVLVTITRFTLIKRFKRAGKQKYSIESVEEASFLVNAFTVTIIKVEAEKDKEWNKEKKEQPLTTSISTTPSLLENSLLPISSIGVNYRFIKVNIAFSELTGYSEHELKNIKLPDLIHPADKE